MASGAPFRTTCRANLASGPIDAAAQRDAGQGQQGESGQQRVVGVLAATDRANIILDRDASGEFVIRAGIVGLVPDGIELDFRSGHITDLLPKRHG